MQQNVYRHYTDGRTELLKPIDTGFDADQDYLFIAHPSAMGVMCPYKWRRTNFYYFIMKIASYGYGWAYMSVVR